MRDKMAISVVKKDLFLRLQMKAKEDFNRHQLFSRNKQYVSRQVIFLIWISAAMARRIKQFLIVFFVHRYVIRLH